MKGKNMGSKKKAKKVSAKSPKRQKAKAKSKKKKAKPRKRVKSISEGALLARAEMPKVEAAASTVALPSGTEAATTSGFAPMDEAFEDLDGGEIVDDEDNDLQGADDEDEEGYF